MADPRGGFYGRVLADLLDGGLIRRDMSVLVAAGGQADRKVLLAAEFDDVTISNLDEGEAGAGLEPYGWRYEDAESLSLPDESVDVAVVSAGLHHCRSPHRALLELYRVARVAVVALESRDSALLRLGARLGAVDDYELGAVAAHGLAAGGVANTSTPNYVYRWTEREVAKTVASFAPHARHRLRFFREFELPDVLLDSVRGPRGLALRALRPAVGLVTRALPSQANLFAFVIEKPNLPRDLQPWLRLDDGRPVPDERVVGARYRIER
ncbi:MAG: methyltransferase domain-containing protein [Actinobacteria bacterium]|nr:methyltransferase domain-containing protein [Actinomycetota bacterium]